MCGSNRTSGVGVQHYQCSKSRFHEDDEESARESILPPCPADGGECSLYEEEEEEVCGEDEEEGEDSGEEDNPGVEEEYLAPWKEKL